ncbi:MAG: glycoside hydrolase family 13 protein [Anaerolineae bacterium]
MSIITPDWVKDTVFYQIFPDRFARSQNSPNPGSMNLQKWGSDPTFHGFQGGNLAGITENLDYMLDLGINAIYLNPIFASASNHRYHTYDYFKIDPLLGDDRAFKQFLKAAHARGIRVVLDGVFNHASRGLFQFNHLLECGAESPYIDWFRVKSWPVNAYDENAPPTYDAWWGLHALPKFNTNSTAVREFLWNVGTYWLEQGIDGWRLDVPNEIDDDAFWQEFRRRCKAVNPDAYIVGELWGEAQRWLQGDQFDAQMNYLFTRAVFGFFVGDKMDQTDTGRTGLGHIRSLGAAEFANELDRICNRLYHPEIVLAQMNMLGSHDTPRMMTIARHDVTAVKLMFLCQMTMPGAPAIYYGDEIGMAGGRDPECRCAFPWHAPSSWNQELRQEVKQAIELRRATPALRRGDFRILHADDSVVVYQREVHQQTAVIAFNTAEEEREFLCPDSIRQLLAEKLVSAGGPLQPGQRVTLPGRSGRIWANT